MSQEKTQDSRDHNGWRTYYGAGWVPSDPPQANEVVEWMRMGTAQQFTGKSEDFDPAFNVAGLLWRKLK